jgi:hypothetical protein
LDGLFTKYSNVDPNARNENKLAKWTIVGIPKF